MNTNNNAKDAAAAVADAADAMGTFSVELANAFRTQPFNRVDLAVAFAAGFVQNDTDDPHPTAAAVLQVAFLDREVRRAAATAYYNQDSPTSW